MRETTQTLSPVRIELVCGRGRNTALWHSVYQVLCGSRFTQNVRVLQEPSSDFSYRHSTARAGYELIRLSN